MKRFSEQLHKKATTSVKLKAAEKRELREQLVSYMEYHPLPAELKAAKTKRVMPESLKTDPFTTISIKLGTFIRSATVAAVVLLVIVPLMAEKAVPGDTLYAIKVQTEELRSTLTFDGYQKVEWETERLNRRIAEARLLASEGRLTEEVEAEVAEAVRTHTENAKREIAVLQGEDADEAMLATIALDTTLEVQATTFKEEEVAAGELEAVEGSDTSLIAAAVDESRDETVEPGATSTLPAYEKLTARVEMNTTRVYELLATLQESVSDEQLAEVVRRLEDIERSIAAATVTYETDAVAGRQRLVDVLQRTQKLIVYMTELEVSETVDIETLVPVVLTEAEEVARESELRAELAAQLSLMDRQLSVVEEAVIWEKAAVASSTVIELTAKLSSTTDFVTIESTLQEAINMVLDMNTMLEQYLTPEAVTTIIEEVDPTATSTDETATSTEEVVEEPIETTTPPEEVAEEPAPVDDELGEGSGSADESTSLESEAAEESVVEPVVDDTL